MTNNLDTVYHLIINNVVRGVRDDFIEQGVDESVLTTLKQSWESRVKATNVVHNFQLSTDVSDPDKDTGKDASSKDLPLQQPKVKQEDNPLAAASLASLVTPNQPENSPNLASSGLNGASPTGNPPPPTGGLESKDSNALAVPGSSTDNGGLLKGPDDVDEKPKDSGRKARRLNNGRADQADDEDAINSELDDSDDDDENNGIDDKEPNIILCQYEKVTRTKNKWKCVLKDGVMTMDGRDFLFNRATGEFEW